MTVQGCSHDQAVVAASRSVFGVDLGLTDVLIEPFGRRQCLLAAVVVKEDGSQVEQRACMIYQSGSVLDQGGNLGTGRVSSGGFCMNQCDKLHNGTNRIGPNNLFVLVPGG